MQLERLYTTLTDLSVNNTSTTNIKNSSNQMTYFAPYFSAEIKNKSDSSCMPLCWKSKPTNPHQTDVDAGKLNQDLFENQISTDDTQVDYDIYLNETCVYGDHSSTLSIPKINNPHKTTDTPTVPDTATNTTKFKK